MSSNSTINSFTRQSIAFQKEINVDVHLLYYSNFLPEDFFDLLTPSEKIKVQNFKSIKRQRELLAVRILKKELFGKHEILYSNLGAPYIKDEDFISISHANNVVAIAISKSRVGLDLEPVNDKIHRVKHKFLSESESKIFDTSSTLDLIRVWSAKEALYKLSGENGLIFSENLLLLRQQGDLIFGKISTQKQNKLITLQVTLVRDFVVSVNVSAI